MPVLISVADFVDVLEVKDLRSVLRARYKPPVKHASDLPCRLLPCCKLQPAATPDLLRQACRGGSDSLACCRESPFTVDNNAGGGFGALIRKLLASKPAI